MTRKLESKEIKYDWEVLWRAFLALTTTMSINDTERRQLPTMPSSYSKTINVIRIMYVIQMDDNLQNNRDTSDSNCNNVRNPTDIKNF